MQILQELFYYKKIIAKYNRYINNSKIPNEKG